MTIEDAKEIYNSFSKKGRIRKVLGLSPDRMVELDGKFSATELEAIVTLMRGSYAGTSME